MQGMMGSYLEGNLQAFVDLQARIAEQSKGLYDPKAFTPESWAQLMSGPAPLMQGLMGGYLEQSRNLFVQMQEKMQAQFQHGVLFPIPGLTPKK
jgi:polyhydroxyalkanoate synthesis regulator protein